MKAQEKAVELYNLYASILPDAVEISHNTIKNCAIALCKEVLISNNEATIYWQEVLSEIEKL